jgi:hypothetical protein
VRLNGIPFTVIGEFEPKGKFFGNNFDEVAASRTRSSTSTSARRPRRRRGSRRRASCSWTRSRVSRSRATRRSADQRGAARAPAPASNKPNNFVVFSDDAFISLYNTSPAASSRSCS